MENENQNNNEKIKDNNEEEVTHDKAITDDEVVENAEEIEQAEENENNKISTQINEIKEEILNLKNLFTEIKTWILDSEQAIIKEEIKEEVKEELNDEENTYTLGLEDLDLTL